MTGPDYVGLRRLLATGAPTTSEAVALAAREGEVVRLALQADPGLARWLDAPARRQSVIDAALEQATMVAADALRGQRVVLLKGSAAARWVYAETALRFRRDIDLLVDDQPRARQSLLAAGFVDRADPTRAAEGPSATRAWPMAWRAPFGEVEVDLHRQILAHPWCALDPAALLDHATASTPLPITDLLDTLIHTAVHLVDSGLRQPLKGWVDVHRLASLVDAPALAERAASYRAKTATWACLHVAQRWFGAPVLLEAPAHARLIAWALSGDGAHPHRVLQDRARARDLARLLLSDDLRARAAYLGSRLM